MQFVNKKTTYYIKYRLAYKIVVESEKLSLQCIKLPHSILYVFYVCCHWRNNK